jgi:YVTN family beta-propeller protein
MVRHVSKSRRALRAIGPVTVVAALGIVLPSPADAATKKARKVVKAPVFDVPTTSSPVAISRDGKLVWSVNPGAGTVSVIRTDANRVVATVKVGNEPEAVALDPGNRYAYVANAAGANVSVIRIADPRASRFRTGGVRTITTGAEPYNVVVSPDGRRVFVANSNEDTVSVIDAQARTVIGNVNLRNSRCNDPDRARHFQPRGLAVTRDSKRLYVTGFLAFTRPGGRQADDGGKEGTVCRLDIRTTSRRLGGYRPAARTSIAPQLTGFAVDSNGDATPDATTAFPNQLQSIVIRGGQAFLPNIAASPDGPVRFNVNTQAFVSVLDGVRQGTARDAGPAKFVNLHLGAREPEPNKKRLFFANPWAIAFTNQRGNGQAYVASAGSDLLVKLNVAPDGRLTNTVDADTTRYIDLRDPANPATGGDGAGKNPQGIAITPDGRRAYVMNFVSRNVSVVDLTADRVIKVIRTAPLPPPGSPQEVVNVGADMFFSSRGQFNAPPGATVSTSDRLSSEGWQSCSSCHFKGLTDGVVWEFPSGPRRSVPLNATFNPNNPAEQRVLNYSAIFDEVEDFELNARNVSGPGPLAAPAACTIPPPATSVFDPAHGLLFGDDGNINLAPCVINAFAKPNAGRPQLTVTLRGSTTAVPALTALREWVRVAVRTPMAPLSTTAANGSMVALARQGRALFLAQGCQNCHVGGKWTLSAKDFASPPAATEISTEVPPPPAPPAPGQPAPPAPPPPAGNPVAVQYLQRFLRDIGSFNVGVPGTANDLGGNVGGTEKAAANLVAGVAQPQQGALGIDYNGDGKGIGFNVPSLLGLLSVPPYYHNGACESLACVVSDVDHRTVKGAFPDRLAGGPERAAVTAFLESIDARTPAP